jgi:hypothetical protein
VIFGMIVSRRRLLVLMGGWFSRRLRLSSLFGLRFLYGIELATQCFHFAANLRQTSLDRHDLHLITLRSRWAAKIDLIAGEIFHHPGLSTYDSVIAQRNVIRQSDLASKHDIVARLARSGDTDLAAQQIVSADVAIVRDHDQVIDFGPFSDSCDTISATIDRHVGPDIDMRFDVNVAELGSRDVASFDLAITKTVRTDH